MIVRQVRFDIDLRIIDLLGQAIELSLHLLQFRRNVVYLRFDFEHVFDIFCFSKIRLQSLEQNTASCQTRIQIVKAVGHVDAVRGFRNDFTDRAGRRHRIVKNGRRDVYRHAERTAVFRKIRNITAETLRPRFRRRLRFGKARNFKTDIPRADELSVFGQRQRIIGKSTGGFFFGRIDAAGTHGRAVGCIFHCSKVFTRTAAGQNTRSSKNYQQNYRPYPFHQYLRYILLTTEIPIRYKPRGMYRYSYRDACVKTCDLIR